MPESTVLDVGGLHWATSTAVIESALLRRPGVSAVQANAVNQTATVTYDPATTSWVNLRTGCATADSTAPAAQFPTTSAIRWPNRRPTPSRRAMSTTAITLPRRARRRTR